MRILGIDTGTKRIGVAISDELLLTAQGMETIECAGPDKDILKIRKMVEEFNIEEIVVGLPLNMNGTESGKTLEVRGFIARLSGAVRVPVRMWDERLTSKEADRAMLEADISRKKRKALSDRLSAQLILQAYLDARRNRC